MCCANHLKHGRFCLFWSSVFENPGLMFKQRFPKQKRTLQTIESGEFYRSYEEERYK